MYSTSMVVGAAAGCGWVGSGDGAANGPSPTGSPVGRGYLLSIFSLRHHRSNGVDGGDGRAHPCALGAWTSDVRRWTTRSGSGVRRSTDGGRSASDGRSRSSPCPLPTPEDRIPTAPRRAVHLRGSHVEASSRE